MHNLRFITYFFLGSALILACNKEPPMGSNSQYNPDRSDTVLIDSIINQALSYAIKLRYANKDSMRHICEEMLELSRSIDYREGIACANYTYAEFFIEKPDYDSAIFFFDRAFTLYEALHDTFTMAEIQRRLSLVYNGSSRVDEAIVAINLSRKYYEILNLTRMIYVCIGMQADYQRQLQNTEKQALYLDEMREMLKYFPNKRYNADYNRRLADYNLGQGNLKLAIELYFKALDFFDTTNFYWHKMNALNGIAMVNFYLKDYDTAIEYFKRVENLLINTQYSEYHIGKTYKWLGQCYTEKKDYITGLSYLHKSLSIRRRMRNNFETIRTLQNLALIHFYREDSLETALKYLDEAQELNRGFKNKKEIAENLILKGKIEYLKGNMNMAVQLVESGLSIAEEYHLPELIIDGAQALSQWYAARGLYQKAYVLNQRYNELNDSLLSGENYKQTFRLELQHEFDKRQNEAELKHLKEKMQIEAKLTRSKQARNYLIVIAILLIGMGSYIFRVYSRTRKAEKEKSALLKEIHHRVKNNLQVISSLLNLQSGTLSDDLSKTAVTESKSRVKSMALIHQLLYQSEMFTNINFASYLEQLMSSLHSTYCKPGENIRYKISAEPIKLDVDRAIPMGLIINELVTNAYKYAFQGKKEGNIEICLTKQPENDLLLSIADNGIGLPEKIDIQKTNSLGLRLVNLLVKQLKANINHERKNGTIIKIWIPSAA
jgi:two-component sensor histidine kinase